MPRALTYARNATDWETPPKGTSSGIPPLTSDAAKVEIWSDIACPWCYVGKRRFEAALAGFEHRDEVEVTWRSFELDPDAPREREGDAREHLAASTARRREQAEAMHAADDRRWRPRRASSSASTSPAAATRSTPTGCSTWPPRTAVQDAMKERLFRAYLGEGELDRRPGRARAARGARPACRPRRSREVLAGDRYAAEVREDEQPPRRSASPRCRSSWSTAPSPPRAPSRRRCSRERLDARPPQHPLRGRLFRGYVVFPCRSSAMAGNRLAPSGRGSIERMRPSTALTAAVIASLTTAAVEPATQAQTISRPARVDANEIQTVRGRNWPVIEFCSRTIRVSVRSAQNSAPIAQRRVSDTDRFRFHWVPQNKKSVPVAGAWWRGCAARAARTARRSSCGRARRSGFGPSASSGGSSAAHAA